MSRHVKVTPMNDYDGKACYLMTVNLWLHDDAHLDTCRMKIVNVKPTRAGVKRFYKASRADWRRGARK